MRLNIRKIKQNAYLLVSIVFFSIYVVKQQFDGKHASIKYICGSFPQPQESEIFYDNLMWQVLPTPDRFLYLLRAYKDLRWNHSVVITAIGTKYVLQPDKLFCQYWFKNKTEPFIVKASKVHNMYRIQKSDAVGKNDAPFLIYCPYKFNKTHPHSVSLTLSTCEKAQNLLKIIDNQPPDGVKKKFVVCTKPLVLTKNFTPIQFVEWIETLKILGAEKIFIYHRYFDKKIFKIAKYYEKKGFMVLEQYLEPSGVSRATTHTYGSRINEMPIFNDCFYRNKNLYEYIVAVDHDEILIPTRENDTTWVDLIRSIGNTEGIDAFALHSVTYPPYINDYLPEVPSYYYMLQHVQRSVYFKANLPVFTSKSIMVPQNVSVIFTHGVEYCHDRECNVRYVNESIGQCSHYREKIKQDFENQTLIDKTFWKYKVKLIAAVEKVLDEINFKNLGKL